jgi:hypothetical protein
LAFEQYNSSSVAEVMAHIEFEFFKAFSVPVSQDGMTHVGKQGRAIDAQYLLNQWSDGKEAGNFKRDPNIFRNAANIWAMSPAARQARMEMWKMH